MMAVLDENGRSHEACLLTTPKNAKSQLRLWQEEYIFDYVEALNQLSQYFDSRDKCAAKAKKQTFNDQKIIDATLAEIAQTVLKIPSLSNDRAKWPVHYERSAEQIESALRAAYNAGRDYVK
jgi:phosphate uptake regulator